MTARLIDGRAAALELRSRVAEAVEPFRAAVGRAPGLAVVLVGEHPPSAAYVRSKVKATLEAGMESFEHRVPADISRADLVALVDRLNADPKVDGILVQLPLPGQVDEQAVLTRVDPAKDVDGFHPTNVGRLSIGLDALVPCTPLGCLLLLQRELGDLSGREAVVAGRSNIVGKPMAQLLLQANCTVTVAHSRTRDLPQVVRRADIVIAAVGRPELIRGDWLKPGATIIDVGQERVEQPDGTRKLLGDVAFEEAMEVAGAITPVPGGVGPMTIACLLRNTMVAAHRREALTPTGRPVIELFTTAFITLAVIIDPPGCAPIFASLTSGTDGAHRRSMAIRSVAVAWSILMFFALLGEPLLRTLGISLSAFRLAGGIMLFMIALDMVFERRTERREERAKEIEGTPDAEDISVFPMAIPMIAGPGSIASIMLLSARAEGTLEGLVVLAAMTAVILLTLISLLLAGPLMKLIGARLEAMITRILGVILAALAAQFVLDGLERSLPGLAG